MGKYKNYTLFICFARLSVPLRQVQDLSLSVIKMLITILLLTSCMTLLTLAAATECLKIVVHNTAFGRLNLTLPLYPKTLATRPHHLSLEF